MAGKQRLPGTRGRSRPTHDRAQRIVGVLGLIFFGLLVTIPGQADRARTDGAGSALTVAPAKAGPSPHPAPGNRLTSGRTQGATPVIPAPAPQAPPARVPAAPHIAAPDIGHRLGTAQNASVTGRLDTVTGRQAQLPLLIAQKTPTSSRSFGTRTKAHAVRPISPAQLTRSLIYSSALALAIAAFGLVMLGSRRRLW